MAIAGAVLGALSLAATVIGLGVQYGYVVPKQERQQKAEADKNEVRSKSAKERELNLANSQVRRTALLAGKSMVELINAKRRSTIVSRRAYEAKGNPVEPGGSSRHGTAVTSKVGAASVAPAGVRMSS